ncbi:MAG: copper oxidase, partial [Proteobacteria bacterium]|nr:copper oxidase [Pseudomonadota bacterium]
LPDNTLPMMTGHAQFGPVEMGGMFSVVKVREGLAKNDYKDPGWFKHPEGTVAFEYKGQKLTEAPRPEQRAEAGKKTDKPEWRARDPRKPRLGPDGKPIRRVDSGHSNH